MNEIHSIRLNHQCSSYPELRLQCTSIQKSIHGEVLFIKQFDKKAKLEYFIICTFTQASDNQTAAYMETKQLFTLIEKYQGQSHIDIDFRQLCSDLKNLTQSKIVCFNIFDRNKNQYEIVAVDGTDYINHTWKGSNAVNQLTVVPEEIPKKNIAKLIAPYIKKRLLTSSNVYAAALPHYGFFAFIEPAQKLDPQKEGVAFLLKQIEYSLCQARQANEIAFDNIVSKIQTDIILMIDKNFIIQHVNIVLPGFEKNNVIGSNAISYVLPQYHAQYKKCVGAAFAGESASMEMAITRENQEIVWYKSKFYPPQNNKQHICIVAKDVSEEKRLINDLKKTQLQLLDTHKIGRIATWTFDLSTMYATSSPALEKILEETNIAPKTFDEIAEYVDEGFKELIVKQFQRALLKMEGFDSTLPITTKTGKKIWLRSIVEIKKGEHGQGLFKITSIDVTEQQNLLLEQEKNKKELEKQLKTLEVISQIRNNFILSSDNTSKLFNDILSGVLNITESEYGFIAEIVYDYKGTEHLKMRAINDVNWNTQDNKLIQEQIKENAPYNKADKLYKHILKNNKAVISNHIKLKPDQWKRLTEKHSPLKRYMGIPIHTADGNFIGIIGVANKSDEYTTTDIEMLKPVISSGASIIQALKIDHEKKRAEELLKNEKERFASIIEATGVGTVEWNIQTGVFIINDKWAETLGYSLNELGSLSFDRWLKMLHPNDVAPTLKKANDIRHKLTDKVSGDFRIMHKNGYWIWMRGEGKALKFDNLGEPLIMYGIHADITHERESKQFLLHTLDNLHETQKLAKIGRWELDIQTNTLFWDQIVYDVFEKNPATEKPSYENFLALIHPNDRKAVDEAYQNSLQSKQPYEITHRLLIKGTRIKWVLQKCNTDHDSRGNAIRSIGLVQDITKLKSIEHAAKKQAESYKLISQVTAELIKISSKNFENIMTSVIQKIISFFELEQSRIFKIDVVNRLATTEFIFYNKKKHKPINNVLILKDIEPIMKRFSEEGYFILNEEKNTLQQLTVNADRKKNTVKSFISLPLYTEKGTISGMFNLSSETKEKQWSKDEITVLKLLTNNISDARIKVELETNLIEAKLAAEKANRAKTDFLANISHEIRTPMNAILGYSQILQERLSDPKLNSYVKGISKGGETLLALINDILDFSRIEAGVFTLDPQPTAIRDIFEDLHYVFGASCNDKGLSCTIKIPETFPETILIDNIRLKQILFNLTSNSIKFTEKGGIKIQITNNEYPAKSKLHNLEITVTDTGMGISQSAQGKIFDAFFQQDGQNIRKYGGTGLGLPITKKLVEMMGGEISLKSTPGKGTSFTVYIPHIRAIATPKSKAKNHQSHKDILFDNKTILLVEDNKPNRDIIKGYCENHGLNIIEAENGKEALKKLQEIRPDIILMDIMMPEMDGYEATQKIKSNKKTAKIPVIAVTAKIISPEEQFNQKRFDAYVSKPVIKEHLLEILAKFLPHCEASSTNPSAKLDKKIIQQILKSYREVERLMSIDDIKIFSEMLHQQGERYKNKVLKNLALQLKSYCNNFEMDKLNKLMGELPLLIQKKNISSEM